MLVENKKINLLILLIFIGFLIFIFIYLFFFNVGLGGIIIGSIQSITVISLTILIIIFPFIQEKIKIYKKNPITKKILKVILCLSSFWLLLIPPDNSPNFTSILIFLNLIFSLPILGFILFLSGEIDEFMVEKYKQSLLRVGNSEKTAIIDIKGLTFKNYKFQTKKIEEKISNLIDEFKNWENESR